MQNWRIKINFDETQWPILHFNLKGKKKKKNPYKKPSNHFYILYWIPPQYKRQKGFNEFLCAKKVWKELFPSNFVTIITEKLFTIMGRAFPPLTWAQFGAWRLTTLSFKIHSNLPARMGEIQWEN